MEKIYIELRETGLYKLGFKEGVEKGREKGKIEGKIEGLKTEILLDVEIKFGKGKVGLVRKKIEDIDSIGKLRVIKAEVLKAHSWGDFLRTIQRITQNSNDRSAKSNSKDQKKRREYILQRTQQGKTQYLKRECKK